MPHCQALPGINRSVLYLFRQSEHLRTTILLKNKKSAIKIQKKKKIHSKFSHSKFSGSFHSESRNLMYIINFFSPRCSSYCNLQRAFFQCNLNIIIIGNFFFPRRLSANHLNKRYKFKTEVKNEYVYIYIYIYPLSLVILHEKNGIRD